MDVFKTMLFVEGEGSPQFVDTIWYEDAWWLVATWLQPTAVSTRTPERIVRLAGLRFQDEPGQFLGRSYRFLLNNSIPKSVLDGKEQAGYVVATYPGIAKLPTHGTRH